MTTYSPHGIALTRRRRIRIAIRVLMVLATVAFAIASLIHFGTVITLGPVTIDDPFSGAAIPEAIIALVLGIGSVAVIVRWPAAWRLALATTLFALSVTLYGLSVTVRSARTGDIIYHVTVLLVLLVIVGLLLWPAGRRGV